MSIAGLLLAGPERPAAPVPAAPSQGQARHRCGHGRREQPAASPSTRSIPVFLRRAERKPALAELLALFDAVRVRSAREQALALKLLAERRLP